MKRAIFIGLIVAVGGLVWWYLSNNNTSTMASDQALRNQYNYVIVPESFTLTDEQIETIFALLPTAREQFNDFHNTSEGYRAPAKPLEEYIYQISDRSTQYEGQMVVEVNGLPAHFLDDKNWGIKPIVTSDGGSNYFDAEINLDTKSVFFFSTHGEA